MTVDASGLYPLPPGPTRPLINQAAVLAGDTITGATTETAFTSSQYTFAPNALKVGESYRLEVAGVFTSSALGPNQRPRVRLGNALLLDAGDVAVGMVTAARWEGVMQLSVRAIGTAGKIEATGVLRIYTGSAYADTLVGPTAGAAEAGNPVTVDTTVAQTLRMTTQYSSGVAGNAITMRQCVLIRRVAV